MSEYCHIHPDIGYTLVTIILEIPHEMKHETQLCGSDAVTRDNMIRLVENLNKLL